MISTNLNLARFYDEHEDKPLDLSGLSVISGDCRVETVFHDHFDALERWLARFDCVVGVVAWLTNIKALEALSRVPDGVSIVVNKEDWLRPDGSTGNWKARLRAAYSALPAANQYTIAPGVSTCQWWSDEAIRCAGIFNREKNPASPRVHHKFLVGCTVSKEKDDPWGESTVATPVSVWTGSLNLTGNAERSLENVVIIDDEKVAGAFYLAWRNALLLSESLNWDHAYVTPELRLGT